jgi:hypothetical protein
MAAGRTRETALDEHADSDRLLTAVFPIAQQMLATRGAFAPFGATVLADGTVALAESSPDPAAVSATAMVDALRARFRHHARAGTVRGVVVCYDGHAVDPATGKTRTAVCAELEHATEGCAILFLPYRKRLFGKPAYSDVFGSPLEPRVFLP